MFSRATITLGIGPHFLVKIVLVFEPLVDLLTCLAKDVQNLSN